MTQSRARPEDIIGTGWSFPIRVDARGSIALASSEQDIEQAIGLILGTPVGTRLMRPTFGCRIHELLFAPMNASTVAAAGHYVEEALGMWEPRIDVLDVEVGPDSEAEYCLLITVVYRVRATLSERALVYPFYTIPEE
jgi:phage baseplate assembly protein W